jgi:hypothetical protein
MSNQDTIKIGGVGIFASIGTWFLGAFKWYTTHMPEIGTWITHIAQIGGLFVIYYSIRNLRRNSVDPKK